LRNGEPENEELVVQSEVVPAGWLRCSQFGGFGRRVFYDTESS
jgi:hypothetical protein